MPTKQLPFIGIKKKIMKWIIIPVCIVLLACDNTTISNNVAYIIKDTNPNVDTIIYGINVPSEISDPRYIEKEYFLLANGDTSNYSCFFAFDKVKKRIMMDYVYEPYRKSYVNFSTNDSSSIIANFESLKKFSPYELNYKDQLTEIKLILDAASKEFDLDKLRYLSLNMTALNGLADTITSLYIKKFGDNIETIENVQVAALIRKSTFTYDLDELLSFYKVRIDKVNVDGLICIQKTKSKGNNANVSPINSVDWILDGLVILSLSPID
ncbi:MAG: hypothetical protein CO098_10710 [Bacteroidetes bacterium CG_4_9_14_3_um_filter_41_19]|nr:MAG: hypothetical protein CO098_10710 [Bacteroidetes bacterium CG_4_9_14_3_um_filter_41_19]